MSKNSVSIAPRHLTYWPYNGISSAAFLSPCQRFVWLHQRSMINDQRCSNAVLRWDPPPTPGNVVCCCDYRFFTGIGVLKAETTQDSNNVASSLSCHMRSLVYIRFRADVIDIGNSNCDQASLYILYGNCAYVVLKHLRWHRFEIVFNITEVLLDKKAIAVNFWPVSTGWKLVLVLSS